MSTEKLNEYINSLNLPYSREKSWAHCYQAFWAAHHEPHCTEEIVDTLALHLCTYLSSWGMYRGSSFLLRSMDYTVHIPVVKMILEPRYDALWNLCDDSAADTLWELSEKIKKHYTECRKLVGDEGSATETLITKILLGTMGCIPAYDTKVCDSLGSKGFSTKFQKQSVSEMMTLYQKYKQEIDIWYAALREAEAIENYPLMKAIDTYLWHGA